MFETLRAISEATSRMMAETPAIDAGGKTTPNISANLSPEAQRMKAMQHIIHSLTQKRGLSVSTVPLTRKGGKRDKWAGYTAFVSWIGKDAPLLLAAANEIGQQFQLIFTAQVGRHVSLRVEPAKPGDMPANFISAECILTGNKVYALSRKTRKISTLKGPWKAGGVRIEKGWSLKQPLERPVRQMDLVYELISIKRGSKPLPLGISLDHIVNEAIEKIVPFSDRNGELIESAEKERIALTAEFESFEAEFQALNLLPASP